MVNHDPRSAVREKVGAAVFALANGGLTAPVPTVPPAELRDIDTRIRFCRERMHGFLDPATLGMMAGSDEHRLNLVLVRCGCCRFLVGAQYIEHIVEIIEADGRDYVRDVSLPARGRR